MIIRDLEKNLGNFRLDIPKLCLENGKVHGLIGANGCGKTTLAKLIMGTLEADRGTIEAEGISEREITMTSQRPYLLHDTVYENLIYPLKIRKQKVDEEEVERWLKLCGLEDKRTRWARSLSSGEQQKLSFARAMIFRPKLVLVDETFSNLDPDSAGMFLRLIGEQQKRDPITWILISHQLVHIRRVCDRVHFLSGGHWITAGTPEEMFDAPSDELLRRYLADTEASFRETRDA